MIAGIKKLHKVMSEIYTSEGKIDVNDPKVAAIVNTVDL